MDSCDESEKIYEDSALNEDIGDLIRSLRRAGEDTPANSGGESPANYGNGGDSSSDDDEGLLLRLKKRFGADDDDEEGECQFPRGSSASSPSSSHSLPFVEPLCTWPPRGQLLVNNVFKGDNSDEDDDFETLRAIQRRFSHYESESNDYSLQDKPDREDYSEVESQSNPISLDQSNFPKSAQLLIEALKKNRSCQRFMRNKLIEIEAKMEENKELKNRVKCLMDFQVACKKRLSSSISQKRDPRARLISVEKSTDVEPAKKRRKTTALYYGPVGNSRVSDFREVQKQYPLYFKNKPWTNDEKENLFKGIKQQYQEMLLLNAINIENDIEGANNIDMLQLISNSDLEITPEKMRSFVPMINWSRLASMYLPNRTGTECESRFLNCEDQLINHCKWAPLEDKKLLYIVQNRGIYNWIEISVLLGTNRTPYQCLVRYQRSLNPCILKRKWSKEEDEKLLEAVVTFGDNDWGRVAECLEGRIASQCSNRWKRTLNPERANKGRWFLEEDKRLKIAILLFGTKSWAKIAQFVPGRTAPQCRERWVNCLAPELNQKEWTEEENCMLLEAVNTHGYCWSKIASFFPNRTDSQCLRRWERLCPKEVPQFKRNREIKETVMRSNFVHGKHERPGIGPEDFVVTPLITSGNDENAPRKKLRVTRKKGKGGNDDNDKENSNETSSCIEQDNLARGNIENQEVNVGKKRRYKRKISKFRDNNNNDENQNKRQKRTRQPKEARANSQEGILQNGNNDVNLENSCNLANNNNNNNNNNKSKQRKTDPVWIHGKILENRQHWECNFCKKTFKGGGVTRFKMHLAGIIGDVKKCPKVPLDVRNNIIDELEKLGKNKKPPVRNRREKREGAKETGDGNLDILRLTGPLQYRVETGEDLDPVRLTGGVQPCVETGEEPVEDLELSGPLSPLMC